MLPRSPTLLVCIGLAACDAPEPPRGDTVRIGALLPFTGELAADGANIEKSLLWVTEVLNDAGGIAGKDVELVTRDSGSSIDQGLASVDALVAEGVVAIVGPQDENLGVRMMDAVEAADIVVVSPGVTSTVFRTIDEEDLWFRTSPSALSLGSVLAEEMVADGVARAGIVYVDDVYGSGFADVVRRELDARGSTVAISAPFDADQASRERALVEVRAAEVDAVVLVAYPNLGASVVHDAAFLGWGDTPWYFSHTLYTDVFVRNVAPGAVNGMEGVAPAVPPAEATAFPRDYRKRWPDDEPLRSAFFAYDAIAVLALAIEEASVAAGGDVPDAAAISAHLRSAAASSEGKSATWFDLPAGLELVRSGEAVNYRGASGSVDFDDDGDVPAGLVQLWSVDDGRIRDGETRIANPSTTTE